MPNLDGITATRRIVDTCGDRTRILMLTTIGEDGYVFGALQARASGFLLKEPSHAVSRPEPTLSCDISVAQKDPTLVLISGSRD